MFKRCGRFVPVNKPNATIDRCGHNIISIWKMFCNKMTFVLTKNIFSAAKTWQFVIHRHWYPFIWKLWWPPTSHFFFDYSGPTLCSHTWSKQDAAMSCFFPSSTTARNRGRSKSCAMSVEQTANLVASTCWIDCIAYEKWHFPPATHFCFCNPWI